VITPGMLHGTAKTTIQERQQHAKRDTQYE